LQSRSLRPPRFLAFSRQTVFPVFLRVAALALATYDAPAALDHPNIGRERGFGK